MPKLKSKRQSRSRSTGPADRIRVAQVTAGKTAKRKGDARSAAVLQHRRAESKQIRIIAMLQAPSGATVDGIAQATGWQQHSVRGFLAGIIRKKLGFHLVSEPSEHGRIYRIRERLASTAAAKT
jgi:hypothetical protein